MEKNNHTEILLKSVRSVQSGELHKLFQQSMLLGNFMYDLEINIEEPINFEKRLAWLTKGLYVIKVSNMPSKVIGASFVYKKDNEYYYGAAILPTYYSKKMLDQAVMQTSALSRYCYGVNEINFKLTVFTLAMSQEIPHTRLKTSENKQERYRILVA